MDDWPKIELNMKLRTGRERCLCFVWDGDAFIFHLSWYWKGLWLYGQCSIYSNLFWFCVSVCIAYTNLRVCMLTKHLPFRFNIHSLSSLLYRDYPNNFSKDASLPDKTFSLWSWGQRWRDGGRLRESERVSHCAEWGGGKEQGENLLHEIK